MERCVSGSKERIDSSVSPKKSSRTGLGQARRIKIDDAAAHRVFAGVAHRPGSQEAVGFKPAAITSISTTLPGAAENVSAAMRSRGGTRCTAALMVVDRMRGRSSDERERASRASAVMRCAVMPACGRHAVVGLAIPGREDQNFDLGRDELKRVLERLLALPIARHVDENGRPAAPRQAPRQIGDGERIETVRNARERQAVASFEGVDGVGQGGFHWIGLSNTALSFLGRAKREPDPRGRAEGVQPHEHQR